MTRNTLRAFGIELDVCILFFLFVAPFVRENQYENSALLFDNILVACVRSGFVLSCLHLVVLL